MPTWRALFPHEESFQTQDTMLIFVEILLYVVWTNELPHTRYWNRRYSILKFDNNMDICDDISFDMGDIAF